MIFLCRYNIFRHLVWRLSCKHLFKWISHILQTTHTVRFIKNFDLKLYIIHHSFIHSSVIWNSIVNVIPRCELLGLKVIKEGSSSHDTECIEEKKHTATIISVLVTIIAFTISGTAGIVYTLKKRKRKKGNRYFLHVLM